ncbi:baculoviral IAP repeat-containing protein 1f-like [Neocloeon triangulifer]|uniref:baculoviral IAP repeat-containing protein 1f-like n=1 Tax=Neocloeon triangulifer TaxID=2078957 RepID=UPI00286EE150|nr:baculoviral IAP repeat-containing protein 1f-like [Neocloeon triangulifer]XP_059483182.1 baculoviral IAP repeat-containing protein 1f-like [Neocloeon triangulifer]
MSLSKDQLCAGAPVKNDKVHLLNLNIALHRYFTFTVDFRKKFRGDFETLAEAGFYCLLLNGGMKLRCNFCHLVINESEIHNWTKLDKDQILSQKSCLIHSNDSKNFPLSVNLRNYKFESHRLYSLLKKEDWNVSPADLAADGFYYEGDGDLCRCAFCCVQIYKWEQQDNVHDQHVQWNKECPFLINPEGVQNIPIGKEIVDIAQDSIGEKKTGAEAYQPDHDQQRYQLEGQGQPATDQVIDGQPAAVQLVDGQGQPADFQPVQGEYADDQASEGPPEIIAELQILDEPQNNQHDHNEKN